MNRDKVLELAREAELARQFALEVPFVVDRLERFAALIEREVRGDAEPVAYELVSKSNNVRYTNILESAQECKELGWTVTPLYRHPAPAVTCYHAWIRTGAMGDEEKRCIKCGEWGKR